jgi:hypothetical protein
MDKAVGSREGSPEGELIPRRIMLIVLSRRISEGRAKESLVRSLLRWIARIDLWRGEGEGEGEGKE